MVQIYQEASGVKISQIEDLPNHIASIWLEYMALGLLRGDFSLRDVDNALPFCNTLQEQTSSLVSSLRDHENMLQPIEDPTLPNYNQFHTRWENLLTTHLPEYRQQIESFFSDEEMGFKHSYKVFRDARTLANKVEEHDGTTLNTDLIEQVAVFHDIGKFFQDLHSLENISIAERVYRIYAESCGVPEETIQQGLDGIRNSDFYNYRLNPTSHPPSTLEAEIVRAADKMQDNIVPKVDRYWYKYGVPRGETFFNPNLTDEQRDQFSFENFTGDQLNVILTIISIRPEDFTHPVVQEEYRKWSKPAKEKVVQRIYALAEELGEPLTNTHQLHQVVDRYRQRNAC